MPRRVATYPPQRSIDLHQVNWASVTLPGSVCGANHPIHLHRHGAVVLSNRWSAWPRVTVDSGWNPVVYGDLDGDGSDEAALVIDCNNGGGTADGVLAYAQVIFTPREKSPRVIGVLTPQEQPDNELPTLLQVTIRRGEIVAHEAWYGANDGTCCPSGRSTTTWTYTSERFRPVTPWFSEGPGKHASRVSVLGVCNPNSKPRAPVFRNDP